MSNDVHQLVIASTAGGQYFENVMHWQSNTASSVDPETDSQDLITAFNATCQAAMLATQSPDVSLLGYKAKRVNNTGGPTAVNPVSAATVGTYTGDMSNSRVAAVYTLDYYNSMAAKPSWRVGRMFVGGVPDPAMDDNSWVSAFITAALAFTATLNTPLSGTNTWTTGVWSPTYTTFYSGSIWELTPSIGALKRRIDPHL